MSDLPIASAAVLTGSTLDSSDVLPVLDVSASAGSKGSRITVAELFTGRALVGGTAAGLTGFGLRSMGAAFDLALATSEVLTARHTLSFNVGDADRTLTIPATGTAALLGVAQTFSAANIFNVNGAASTPAISGTGTTFSGGTATSTKPYWLIEPGGTTSTGWNTNGTLLGANSASAFTGSLLALQKNAANVFSVEAGNKVNFFDTAAHYVRIDNGFGSPAIVAGYGGGDRCGLILNSGSGGSPMITSISYPVLFGGGSLTGPNASQSFLGWGHTNTQLTFTFGATDKSYSGAFTGAGHNVTLRSGKGSTITTGAAGGLLSLIGGDAGGTGDNNGGNVMIAGGAATGGGSAGQVLIQNLPSSNPGPGILWNNAGTPAIGT